MSRILSNHALIYFTHVSENTKNVCSSATERTQVVTPRWRQGKAGFYRASRRRGARPIRFDITTGIKKNAAAALFTNSRETVSLEGRLWRRHKQSNQSPSISVEVDRGCSPVPLVMLAPCIAFPRPKTTLQTATGLLLKAPNTATKWLLHFPTPPQKKAQKNPKFESVLIYVTRH